MRELGLADFKAISAVLRGAKSEVRLTSLWQALESEYGLGRRQGRLLMLTDHNRERLREIVTTLTGADPMHAEVSGDRIEVAGQVRNEKWSGQGPFAGLIEVASLGPVVTVHGEACTPAGTFLSIAPDAIDMQAFDTVVVVENGIVLRRWHDFARMLPDGLGRVLAVYRGHTAAANEVVRFADAAKTDSRVIGFFDYDLAGFGIAASMGIDEVLVPADPDGIRLLGKSRPELYQKQRGQWAAVLASSGQKLGGWKAHIEWIETHRASITQEAMLACCGETGGLINLKKGD